MRPLHASHPGHRSIDISPTCLAKADMLYDLLRLTAGSGSENADGPTDAPADVELKFTGEIGADKAGAGETDEASMARDEVPICFETFASSASASGAPSTAVLEAFSKARRS